jgi:PAS domain S-box-containing protein
MAAFKKRDFRDDPSSDRQSAAPELSRLRRQWGVWTPVALALAFNLALLPTRNMGALGPQWLAPILNAVFAIVILLLVALLAARSMLAGERRALVLLGSGMLAYAAVSAVGAISVLYGHLSEGVVVLNVGQFFAGGANLAGSLALLAPPKARPWWTRRLTLWSCYVGVIALAAVITWLAYRGLIPPFIVQGKGPTPWRRATLAAVIGEFACACVVLLVSSRRVRSRFLLLYALGLGLIAVGTAGVYMIRTTGNPLGWAGTLSVYMGMAYLLASVILAVRQSGSWRIPQELLRETRERYLSLVEHSPDAIVVHSGGRFVFANPAAARLYGAAAGEDLVGRSALDLVRKDRHDGSDGDSRPPADHWDSLHLEERTIFRLDGAPVAVEVSEASVEYEGRSATQMVLRDIVARKKAEEAVRESEARFRSVLDSSLDCIYRLNLRTGRYEYVSPAAEKVMGISVAELMAQDVEAALALIHPDDVDEMLAALERSEASGEATLEYRQRTKSGDYRWISNHVSLTRDSDGRRAYRDGILRDITEQKSAEEALKKSELSLAQAQRIGQIGSWEWNVKTGQVRWSAQLYAIYRVDPGAFVPTMGSFAAFIHPEDRNSVQEAIDQIMTSGGSVNFDFRIVAGDGSTRVLNTVGEVIEADDDGAPSVVVGVNQDITERKRAEEELKRARDELEQRVSERTAELASTVTRLEQEASARARALEELRRLNLSLQEQADQLRRLSSELAMVEQRERKRLALILHDNLQQLLTAARFRTGFLARVQAQDVRAAAGAVDELLSQAIDASRTLTGELSPPILFEAGLQPALRWLAKWMQDKYSLTVDVVALDEPKPLEEGASIFLFRTVRELLFNAQKHAKVKTATVQMRQEADSVEIVVHDKGEGFDPATVGDHGGMGLFGIREQLAFRGGRLAIESAQGKGTRIRVVMPIVSGPLSRETSQSPIANAGVGPAVSAGGADGLTARAVGTNRVRVLLVDDHPVVRQGLAELLGHHADIEVIGEAGDGKQAVEAAQRLNPDVIVMDISMPKMSGIEATRVIHEARPHIRIIGLSIYRASEQEAAMKRAGAFAFVTKGGPTTAIVDAIRAATRRLP